MIDACLPPLATRKINLKLITMGWPSFRPRSTRGTAAAVAAPLLVVLMALASAASLAEAWYEAVDVHVTSDLCTRPYKELFDVLHRTLGHTLPIMAIEGHRFLSIKDAEQGTPPARTIKLHLAGCSDEDRVTLALSDGDASVMAFADSAGLWHAFPGFEPLFPNSTTLPFNCSYDHLIGGHRNLHTVPLGKASALEAVRALSRPGTAVEPDAKAALVRLMTMTSEALRWKPIREAFSGDWESETFITKEQAEFVPHWVDLSYLVWRWEVTGAWEEGVEAKGLEEIGVHNAAQALSIVDLMKRPSQLCVGLGRNHHGEEYDDEDDESGIAVEEAGGGGAAALHQDL